MSGQDQTQPASDEAQHHDLARAVNTLATSHLSGPPPQYNMRQEPQQQQWQPIPSHMDSRQYYQHQSAGPADYVIHQPHQPRPGRHMSNSRPASVVWPGRERTRDTPESSRASQPKLSLSKSISYDGKGDWQAFITKFKYYADGQKWTARNRRDVLSWNLEGKASEFYSRMVERDPDLDYFEVLEKLERRFDIKDLPETLQIQLSIAAQAPKESLVEWSDRVVTMAMRANPDLTDSQVYKQAVLRFCQGCLDKDAGLFVMNQRPRDIEEALDKIKWFQHTNQVVYGRVKKEIRTVGREAWDDGGSSKVARAVNPAPQRSAPVAKLMNPEPEAGWTTQLAATNNRMDSFEKKMESMAETLKLISLAVTRPRGRTPSRSPSRNTCFSCNTEGHFKAECPLLKKGQSHAAIKQVGQTEESENSEESDY